MSINDERVRFYLRHREQLEEWQALRGEAATAIDEWLTTLKPDVESAVEELGPDVQLVSFLEDTSFPSLDLRRPWWPGGQKAEADVLVGLQWMRGKTLLGPASAPYVGVRSSRESTIGRVLRGDADFQRVRKERKDKNIQWWPAYSYVAPQVPFPDEAEQYRRALVDAITGAWKVYAEIIDRAVASGTAPAIG